MKIKNEKIKIKLSMKHDNKCISKFKREMQNTIYLDITVIKFFNDEKIRPTRT